MIMEAKKFHICNPPAIDPGIPFQSESKGSKTRGAGLSLRAGEDRCPSLAGGQEAKRKNSSFFHPLLSLSPQQIGLGLLMLGRPICFTESPDSNTDLILTHPHGDTQKQHLIWVLLRSSQVDT